AIRPWPSNSRGAALSAATLTMPHALIIDDDQTNSAALAEMIADEGFTTATASTLAAAREQLKEAPDIVLLDLVLPDGNGIDLLSDLTPDATTEVIVVTGHASIESSIEAIRRGASDYLLKPVNRSEEHTSELQSRSDLVCRLLLE